MMGMVVPALLASVLPLQAQPAVVTGRVFDSLRLQPLARVTVQLSGTPFATTTGPDGTYRLAIDLQGKRTLTFTEPRLDRLLGALSSEVDLLRGSEVRVDVAIPRVLPSPMVLCGGGSADTIGVGGAVGVVRDSSTGLPISGAAVTAFWRSEADTGDSGRGLQTRSGEDGGFLLCRLPTDRTVTLLARTPGREVGVQVRRLSRETILDLDLVVLASADSGAAGRLRGRVTDSATGAALEGSDVMIVESGLHATTNAAGEFSIEHVVPGKMSVVVRQIGYRPEFLPAELTAGGTASVTARLRPAPFRLEDLEIRAAGVEYKEFLERQKNGIGKYWDAEEIRRFDGGSMTALLARKVELRETRGVLINLSRGRRCPIPVVMNGVLWLDGAAANLRPEQFDAIEYYSGPAQVPMEFQSMHLRTKGFACGLLVVWQRGIK